MSSPAQGDSSLIEFFCPNIFICMSLFSRKNSVCTIKQKKNYLKRVSARICSTMETTCVFYKN